MTAGHGNTEIVRDFCAAWSRRNATELTAYFTDGAVYHNIPMKPAKGRPAIAAFIEQFLAGATAVEFELLNTAGAGDVVFTERVDRFELNGKRIELPVAGVFELRDGKIAAWRDYFDLQTWMKQTQA